uniref:Putative serine/threonine protein kinase n=1 Tax=Gemmata sp. Wa1-1 TaxID=235140 RepID=Q5EUI4_9BACT|nr:putative serine/threonine protein kinase [Gemmata sp. Wa1-1]
MGRSGRGSTPGGTGPPDEAARLLDGVARALDHIHGQGVLHLDLKPENILYAADGQIKVTDFGLSVPHADASARLDDGYFCATLDYCAPEYRSGLALDARADVFSLATVAYELFTGRLPGRVYVPASHRNPQLPQALDDVLRRGLARDPAQRYASIEAFRHALVRACGGGGRVSFRLLGAFAALVVLVVLPLVAYKWWPAAPQSTGDPPDVSGPRAGGGERPDRLLVLYDEPDDLALLTGADGGELTGGPVPVERLLIGTPPPPLPTDLPLAVWPAPRPAW